QVEVPVEASIDGRRKSSGLPVSSHRASGQLQPRIPEHEAHANGGVRPVEDPGKERTDEIRISIHQHIGSETAPYAGGVVDGQVDADVAEELPVREPLL